MNNIKIFENDLPSEIDLSNEPVAGPGPEDKSSFLNDMVQFADNWELYFD